VPLDAVEPAEWRQDPWIVASRVFAPSFYIGGWTACEHWGLTEQIFRETVVVTTRRFRHRTIEIQGFLFHVKRVAKQKIFGTQAVWRSQTRIQISDPTRTIVDILDDPSLGGGIRHIAEVLDTYLRGDHRNDELLIEYVRKLGNRSIFKRLGYLMETLRIQAPALLNVCKNEMSSGISLLDPTLPAKGSTLRRWNLRVNAAVGTEGAAR
jgi:predicted transcriptional regulator of viral defense system